jgi:hypothetical protein
LAYYAFKLYKVDFLNSLGTKAGLMIHVEERYYETEGEDYEQVHDKEHEPALCSCCVF